jgi:hypothetical protein
MRLRKSLSFEADGCCTVRVSEERARTRSSDERLRD